MIFKLAGDGKMSYLGNLAKYIITQSSNVFKRKKNAVILASTSISTVVLAQDVNKKTASSYFWSSIRFLRSLKIGIAISLDYYFSSMGLNETLPNYKPMMSLIHKRAASRILEGCLINGGTYIKLGQGLVSLSHILPAEYIHILTTLQDKCLIQDRSELFQIIEEDLRKKPSDMFKWIEERPIAAASLAQVFKAETLNGDVVAIKVQYIDLQDRFVSDVATIDFLLKFIAFIHPSFNFGWVLTDLSASLKQELDFLKEARNSEKCANDLKEYKFIHIPKVYWEFCSSRILVTEFVDAIKINDVDQLKKEGYNLYDIDLKICEIFGHQIFQTGFVHADPHPGNLFVRKKDKSPEIVLIDHGLYQEVEKSTQLALRGIWKAIVFKETSKMQYYSNLLGVENYEVLAEILTQRPLRLKGFRLTTRITEEQMQFMANEARNKFDEIMQVLRIIPRSLLLVIRNLNTIRSITHDHGDPIDRYAVLARCASETTDTGLINRAKYISTRFHIEFKIMTGRLWVWCIKFYLKVLRILGRSPDTSLLVADLS